jgi:hypothetical protein
MRPRRLPKPMSGPEVEALLSGLKKLRDLAMLLLMLEADSARVRCYRCTWRTSPTAVAASRSANAMTTLEVPAGELLVKQVCERGQLLGRPVGAPDQGQL